MGLAFQENVNSLLPVFEEFLKNAPNDASYDAVRQSVVVLMGSLAKHLDKSDPKVKPIVAKLIAALSTPSQQVPASWPRAYKPAGGLGPPAGVQRGARAKLGIRALLLCKESSFRAGLVCSEEYLERELLCSSRFSRYFYFFYSFTNSLFVT